jgi:TolB-like protein
MDALQFRDFTWHPLGNVLLRDGVAQPMGSRALAILNQLLRHRDRVVSKTELLDGVWNGAFVEENNLTVQVSALRKLLGRDAIATVPGRGYRWSAPVTPVPVADTTELRHEVAEKPTISVLAFEVRGAGEDQEFLGDGIAQEVASGLSRSPWLLVIAHDSAMTFRGSSLRLREISNRLGAKYLVRGVVSRKADRLQVSVELIFGPTSELLLALRLDRAAQDLFEVQDELSRRVIGAIEPSFLRREESKARLRRPEDIAQWELLMRARWHYGRASRWHVREGQRLLGLALARHPDDGTALALLAFGRATEVWSGWCTDPVAVAEEACCLALRAVSLDEQDPWAHFMLGVASQGLGLLDRAIAEHRRALALYPHFAAAAGELGRMLVFQGETHEGSALIRQAIAWSPAEPHLGLWFFGLATAQFIETDYLEAARLAQEGINVRADWFFNHYLRAACLCLAGHMAQAGESFAEARRLLPTFDRRTLTMGHPFKDTAHRDRYIQALKRLGWAG